MSNRTVCSVAQNRELWLPMLRAISASAVGGWATQQRLWEQVRKDVPGGEEAAGQAIGRGFFALKNAGLVEVVGEKDTRKYRLSERGLQAVGQMAVTVRKVSEQVVTLQKRSDVLVFFD
jgi:DNA-binding transcriptional regulator PaaX